MIRFKEKSGPNCVRIVSTEGLILVMPAMALVDDAHPNLDLCLHKGIDWYVEWTVSERSTGLLIATGDTQIDAIELASARLATKTDDEIAAALENGRKRMAEAVRA